MIIRARNILALVASAALAASCGGGSSKSTGGGTGGGGTGGGDTGTGIGDGQSWGGTVDPNALQVSLADVGLEKESMDLSADPCEDFYQFTCGGWLKSHEIPADKARYARFTEIDDRNEEALHAILEDARAGKGGDDPIMKKLGDFYGSCMDEAGIEKAGLTGLQPLLNVIKKVKDQKSLLGAIVALHNGNIGVLFGAGPEGDFANSKMNVLWIGDAGLGLPDRDYYFSEDFKPKVDAYRTHVENVFKLLGRTPEQAKAAAESVLSIEMKLAEKTKTATEKRDLPKLYNPMDVKSLSKLTTKIDWKTYLKGRGNANQAKVVVTTPDYMKRVDELLKALKPAQFQDYFTYHLIEQPVFVWAPQSYSFALPKAFDEEHFAFVKSLTGVEQQEDRWKRCVTATSNAMPEALAQPYIARMFPGNSKQAATDTVAAVAQAFGGQIDSLDWMSAETKAAAKNKLTKLSGMIGYPDKWREYTFDVKADNFAANLVAAVKFEAKRQYTKAGKAYDPNEWLMPAYIVNAYYNPLANNTGLPAGILQPPFFGHERMPQANLGGIGMVVGHELTHGFDDQGAQFDAEGNMKMWWQKADFEKFQAKGKCVAEQYSTFETLPGKFVNGELTLGENIADIGGAKNAFHAYRAQRANAEKKTNAEGFNEDQQFFIAAGQIWCSKDRPDEALRRLTTDSHSPPMWRVNGTLRNVPEFAEAFNCKPGSKMNPAKRCTVW
jgi:putative endopeptidase